MAVTFTENKRLNHMGGNIYTLSIGLYAAGDASGGNVSATVNLTNLLPDDEVIFVTGGARHDAAATIPFITTIEPVHWTGLNAADSNQTVALILVPASSWHQYSNLYNQKDHVRHAGLYLGKPIVSPPTVSALFVTNTDGKYYRAWLNFRVRRSKSA
jgi:hypothetical protein